MAKRDLYLPRLLKQLGRNDALIIDDIGYVQHSRRGDGGPLCAAGLPVRNAAVS